MGEDGNHTAYFWVYLRDGRSSGDMTPPAVAFRFTTGRGGEHPAAHLAGYEGFLQADGYGDYNVLYRNPKTKAPRRVTELGIRPIIWSPVLSGAPRRDGWCSVKNAWLCFVIKSERL